MVTSAYNSHERRVLHPTREGSVATAYYLAGHLLDLAGLALLVAFMYWLGRQPTSILAGVAILVAAWSVGRLVRWAHRLAWDEVPGAYRVYSITAGDRLKDPQGSPVSWDYAMGAIRISAGVVAGVWFASRTDIEPDWRASLLAIVGAMLASLGLIRAIRTTVKSPWRAHLGTFLLIWLPVTTGVVWVSVATQVRGAQPVLGIAIAIAVLTFALAIGVSLVRWSFRTTWGEHPDE